MLPPRGVVYGVASRRVFDTVRARMPVLEQLSYDEAFGEPAELADASAADVERFCEELRGCVRDATGLVASVGAGSGKQIAKIGSELAKPDGIRVIGRDEEQALLAGLPVRRLWGIGPVAEDKLHRLGIQTIGQLAELTDAEAADILGATVGPALHRLARGVDDRPVAERAEAKQISAESTFAADLTTMEQLQQAAGPIGEHAHQRLMKDGRGARTVTVKLKRSDMSTLTRSLTLPYATADPATFDRGRPTAASRPTGGRPDPPCRRGFSGLSEVRQEPLFSDLDSWDQPTDTRSAPTPTAAISSWRIGDDVNHDQWGHGWVQGAGHGVMTVRFETRANGPGPARTLSADDPVVTAGQPGRQPGLAGVRRRLASRSQPQRAKTSPTGEPVANAAIINTRACGGRSRCTSTAPASANSLPGP